VCGGGGSLPVKNVRPLNVCQSVTRDSRWWSRLGDIGCGQDRGFWTTWHALLEGFDTCLKGGHLWQPHSWSGTFHTKVKSKIPPLTARLQYKTLLLVVASDYRSTVIQIFFLDDSGQGARLSKQLISRSRPIGSCNALVCISDFTRNSNARS